MEAKFCHITEVVRLYGVNLSILDCTSKGACMVRLERMSDYTEVPARVSVFRLGHSYMQAPSNTERQYRNKFLTVTKNKMFFNSY